MNPEFRLSRSDDLERIVNVHLNAFGEEEGDAIARLVSDLLRNQHADRSLSIAAVIEKTIVGHVVFSPVILSSAPNVKAFILAPLAIDPKYQKTGIGTKLVNYGLDLLRQQHVTVVLVYGDPSYYSRFGFSVEYADHFKPPYPLKHPHGWQVMSLEQEDSLELTAKIHCVDALCRPELW